MKTFHKKLQTTNYKLQAGFTLIEIVVSVGIFAIVMSVAATSLLSIIDANKKAHALQIVMDNLNFALASVSRQLRVGTAYHCGAGGSLTSPQDCPDNNVGDTFLAFRSAGGNLMAYRFNANRLERSVDSGPYVGITAPEIIIQRLRFFVTGTAPTPGDRRQPRALIIVEGFVGGGTRAESRFNIQTTVAQRELDY
ncbi:MAG: Uncharacterized protein G01um101472_458 [Parcubacteria group bacterium Gr01-1014_72]|nr:MAG: Uncharacterized protein G01um101472_458 [Parcubacteria group bacterium Gr01-1014_72]